MTCLWQVFGVLLLYCNRKYIELIAVVNQQHPLGHIRDLVREGVPLLQEDISTLMLNAFDDPKKTHLVSPHDLSSLKVCSFYLWLKLRPVALYSSSLSWRGWLRSRLWVAPKRRRRCKSSLHFSNLEKKEGAYGEYWCGLG